MLYIIIAILAFGLLIAVHEFGHFITAKLLGVRVNEFAIGMGPKLISKQKGETLYSWRAFPIGGYCAMEGEDEDSNDLKAFSNKQAWKKLVILVAGSFMNFLTGFLIMAVLLSQASFVGLPVISGFADGFEVSGEGGLMAGDRIISIDGKHIFNTNDASLYFNRADDGTMDIAVERNGEKIELDDLPLTAKEYVTDGRAELRYGIDFTVVSATPLLNLQQSWYATINFVRMVWMSLGDLVTGAVGVKDLSGPIGIVGMISDVGSTAATPQVAASQIAYFVAFIAVNLAVMNMLPIPALDGGRIFFLAVNGVYSVLTRRKLDPKYEGYINMAGFFCLILLMVVVAFNDVLRLIG